MKSTVLIRTLLLDWARNGTNLLVCFLFLASAAYLGAIGVTFASDGAPALVGYLLPGLIAVFVMTNGVVLLSWANSDMIESGLLKRVASTSVSKSNWLLCLTLIQIVTSFTLAMLILLVGALPYGAPLYINGYWPLLIVLGCLPFSGLGVLIANMVGKRFSPKKVSVAVAFLMAIFSGTFWPPTATGFLQGVSAILPLTYLEDGMRASISGGNLHAAAFDIAVTAFLGIAFLGLAWASTNWE